MFYMGHTNTIGACSFPMSVPSSFYLRGHIIAIGANSVPTLVHSSYVIHGAHYCNRCQFCANAGPLFIYLTWGTLLRYVPILCQCWSLVHISYMGNIIAICAKSVPMLVPCSYIIHGEHHCDMCQFCAVSVISYALC